MTRKTEDADIKQTIGLAGMTYTGRQKGMASS